MIRRYEYGSPLNTGAAVQTIDKCGEANNYFKVEHTAAGLVFTKALEKKEMIFGLGENVGGINKRGHRYQAWAVDDGNQHENREGLYGAHNFLVFVRESGCFGVFFDDPGEMFLDLGFEDMNTAAITSVNGDVNVYIIDGLNSAAEICREFRRLTGRSYIPPRWALGYIQSRWGYRTADDLRQVLKDHRERHIPLDGLSMDIDYMDDYKDFTWDHKSFPDLPAFSKELKDEHARLVPIMDAGIKEEKGYSVYEEAIQKDLVCKKADGKPFVGSVWPGRCVFTDFMKPEAREWFGNQYHKLLEAGVEGFWNDMNEPALFNSEESIAEAFEKLGTLKETNLHFHEFFEMKDLLGHLSNNRADYERFYQVADGKTVRHDRVHNLYGAMMTRAAAEGFVRYNPDQRYLLFSRSSYIGSHRYGGIWQGDNHSYWSHILLNLKEMPSLNMCGYLYTGADLGGFGADTAADLMARWLQLGVFTPLMRNHSALGCREQEIYRFPNWESMRDTITVRYALLTYLYSEMMQAILRDGMMFRPLAFDYPADETACHTEDQVMLGQACMIAPVYEKNAIGRHVYLPEDMLMVRFTSAEKYDLVPMKKGHHWVELGAEQFPLFIRKGQVIPLTASAEYTEGIDDRSLTLLGWMADETETVLQLYRDDGMTTRPVLEDGITEITVRVKGHQVFAGGKDLLIDCSRVMIR